MRLLYVCTDHGIHPTGTKGASVHLRSITRALCHLGHEVWLLTPEGGAGPGHPSRPLLPAGDRLSDQRLATKMNRRLGNWLTERELDRAAFREMRALTYQAAIHKSALRAAREIAPDAVMERMSLFGHLGMDLANALDIPLVLEINAPLVDEASAKRPLQIDGLAAEIEGRLLTRSDAIMAVSEVLADQIRWRGIPSLKLHTVPNGVDLDLFESAPPRSSCRSRLGLNDEVVIGFVGSFKAWHGVDVLVEAFETVLRGNPKARLLIVGDGPAAPEVRAGVAARGLQSAVRFAGAVPHEEIPSLLGAMDIAVAPFRSGASFYFSPIKIFEYMASGSCVVASRLGQMAKVIEDRVDGLLCEPDDPTALAECLNEACRGADLRRDLGTRARQKAREHFTWDHAARRVSGIVEMVSLRRGAAASPLRDGGPPSSGGPREYLP